MPTIQSVFYSGAIIMLVSLLAFHIISYVDSTRTEGAQVALRMRSGELANLLNAIELDMPRALDISTKRAVLSAINDVDLRGIGLDDATVRMHELILNGTIYDDDALWMNESTLPDWIVRVDALASARGFIINISIEEFLVSQYDSFNIRSHLRWNITVNDSVGSMTVSRNLTTDVLIPIIKFEDPLHLLGTRGLVHRSIYRSNFTVHNVTTLDSAISGGYYFNTSEGPSFMDRLEGNLHLSQKYVDLSDNQIGLETFVNLLDLYSSGMEVRTNQTMVDHLYFNETNITGFEINGSAYVWLRIDQQHAETYGVNGSLIPG